MTIGIVIDSDAEAHIEEPVCTCPADWMLLSCPVHGGRS